MWYGCRITIVATILLTASALFPNSCDKQEGPSAGNPKNSSCCSTNKQKRKTDAKDMCQALSFYYRHWIYFHSLYVDYQGNAVFVAGEGTDVTKYAFGKISESALAGVRQSVKDVNIPSLKPSYSTAKEENLATEMDQFDLRFLSFDKSHVVTGELEAAPESLRKFFQQLLILLKGQTMVQDTPANLFLRVIPFSSVGEEDKDTKKRPKPIRKGGIVAPNINAEKLKELPCLSRAIEREGLIVPCKNADSVRKYLPEIGEAQIKGNYYNVEFFTKALEKIENENKMRNDSASNQ